MFFKVINFIVSVAVLLGIALISVNGYTWYETGEWGGVTFFDMLSYITGQEVDLPERDKNTLYKWIGS